MENATIENFFSNGTTVEALQITDYLHWAANPDQYSCVLSIPPIQRGFVWKPKQIQDLWDSLLRDMPIGSILLKTSHSKDISRPVTSEKTGVQENYKQGFHLMDGQQRTLSMLLGFPSFKEKQHKLWIDFSSSGRNGSEFQFRVTTVNQPFGYNTDGGRLSLQERRDARRDWNGEEPSEEIINKTNLDVFEDGSTRPWKSGGKQKEYIFEIKLLWQWLEEQQAVDKWVEIVKSEISKDQETPLDNAFLDRIKRFGEALDRLKHQWLALIKIPDVKVQAEIVDPSHDYLTMLFDRISTGGTRLSPDDLLFSMIKQSWPDAHNIVYDLQEELGSIMKPTDFVMTAFRLTMLRSEDSKLKGDLPLNAITFHKHLSELLGTEALPGDLRKLIGKEGPLVRVFKKLMELITYSKEHKRGIPNIMFPYLNDSMLQVILYWMLLNVEFIERFESSIEEMVRFILFWLVCNKDKSTAYKASKAAIEIIDSTSKGLFPSVEIYKALTKKDADNKSIFPPLIRLPSCEMDAHELRTQEQRAKEFFGEDNISLYINFTTRKELLLWFQRKWVKGRFEDKYKDFKPMAGEDVDNVPYDFDHLVPQSNWSSLSQVCRDGVLESRKHFEDVYHRRAFGNSIGNYRVLDSSDNRSRGDMPLGNELLNFKSEKEDFLSNYALSSDESEFLKWQLASPPLRKINDEDFTNDGLIWNEDRLRTFQYVVESRVLFLYGRFLEEGGFNAWLEDEQVPVN